LQLDLRRFGIIKVPDDIAPYYTAGRGGASTYLLNTYDLPSRPLFNLPALTLHDATEATRIALALRESLQTRRVIELG
jgi:uncharacterized protein (DUF885 family)